MPSFDSIVVGEDWISEHYFTTDSTKESFQSEVLKLRKQWDEQAREGHDSVLKRFLSERGRFQVELAELLEEPSKASAVYHKVREALGFKGMTTDLTAGRAGTILQVPNVWKSHNGDVLFLESGPVESIEDLLDSAKARMLAHAFIDGKEAELSPPKLVSELFRTDEPPQFIVISGGRWLLLTERERWAEGRYLAADLLLACERNDTKRGGEIDRVLAIFGRESLLPDASESIWWNRILENSIKHTIGVSKDLREGIRLSIEIIANDVLRRREAQGLPLDEVKGQNLARQSLRYLYRILFLLYAEASPEMGVLPIGAGEYNEGYGLDRLRELTLTPLNSPQGRSGTHLYQSLKTLFRLVDRGHHPSVEPGTSSVALEGTTLPTEGNEGLHFDSLKADLFDPKAMADIDLVGLSNAALQKVLEHLLLSKEVKGKDRGFISYAELGVNQLGAVYEGLMSYTGFIAETDLYEVAKDGDSSKGSWVVPVERSESIERKQFVMTKNEVTGELEPVLHEKGTFVFRLAGRERQQSASYYTPEVLTRFVVSQALEELLGKKLDETPADEILKLTICEPALGSGAFAIEAVRQLADAYLKLKQAELGCTIPAENYAVELQKVKAQIALHQVYGVDLNSTAVELAEVSLWLDTMVVGLQAPWFGLHLRRGNSLIGARRATYSRASVNDKSWLTTVPVDAPLSGLASSIASESDDPNVVGRIHHFLLPAAGWGAAVEAKEVKELAGDAQKDLKAWRNRIKAKPTKTQVDRLANLGRRVETLWQFTLRRLEVAESEARRDINYFGKNSDSKTTKVPVSRREIERKLSDPNGAYQRLRRVMDAWHALWFWPLTNEMTSIPLPPTLEEWISGLEAILGKPARESSAATKKKLWKNQTSILDAGAWEDLNTAEDLDLSFAEASDIGSIKDANPWLAVCESVASNQGFHHWELDFASVFARGGFDLQVGNPPWVRPLFDEASLLAEGDPWWQLVDKAPQHEINRRRVETLKRPGLVDVIVSQAAGVTAMKSYFGSSAYPMLTGLQPDLYRCFMEQTWRAAGPSGAIGLIHPESHFTEAKAHVLRRASYSRLRRHWHFTNALKLFEISDTRHFGVHIYGSYRASPDFLMAASIYHPQTVEASLKHDGAGAEPGLKVETGEWDIRPHRSRIFRVTMETLRSWNKLAPGVGSIADIESTMVYPVNISSQRIIDEIGPLDRVGRLELDYSSGWHESADRKKGIFVVADRQVEDWNEFIFQGPHFSLGNPFAKSPLPVVRSNNDWVENDLESVVDDYIPRSYYKRSVDWQNYKAHYTVWKPRGVSALEEYRLAWRRMIAVNSSRSLHAAIIPPGAAHVDAVISAASKSGSCYDLVLLNGFFASLPIDFLVRVLIPSTANSSVINDFPLPKNHPLEIEIVTRSLRLNALSMAYSDLWHRTVLEAKQRGKIIDISPTWSQGEFLVNAMDRRKALVELDALCSLVLGISADQLCTLYRTQFPVLQAYERNDLYDSNGRKVPPSVNKSYQQAGVDLTVEERTAVNAAGIRYTYEFPFVSFDREYDMRQAYSHFAKLMGETN